MLSSKQISYMSHLSRSTGFIEFWPKRIEEKNGQKVDYTISDFESWCDTYLSTSAASNFIGALLKGDLKNAAKVVNHFRYTNDTITV
jgi:hypothetical protein